MEENRKKEKRKILPKRRNYVFVIFLENCAKKNSKTQVFFFFTKFLSNGRVTTRRVNITRGHMKRERIKKKKNEEKK